MPGELRKLALVYLFQWHVMVCYWQYVSLSIAKSVFGATSEDAGYADAVSWTGLVRWAGATDRVTERGTELSRSR